MKKSCSLELILDIKTGGFLSFKNAGLSCLFSDVPKIPFLFFIMHACASTKYIRSKTKENSSPRPLTHR
jgi:hypothetical protein